jgi:hypothetical protein
MDQGKYYELWCQNPDCRAKLGFGQHKTGDTLFPKRKDKEGNWLSDNGWVVYVPNKNRQSDGWDGP